MQEVTTHVGLDVHSERIIIATLTGQAREPVILDIPNVPKVIRRTFKRLVSDVRVAVLLRGRPLRFRVVPAAHRHGDRLRGHRAVAHRARMVASARAVMRTTSGGTRTRPGPRRRGPHRGAGYRGRR